jgi:hypothetical protein
MSFLTSGSDMFTGILPIRIEQNPFWSSSVGLECIKKFLRICTRISGIDQFIVITKDLRVCRLAEQESLKVSGVDIPGSINRPYTFEQTRSLARNFLGFCSNETDALIVVDHRNLFLTAEDIVRANTAHQNAPEAGVVSLAFCRDHPCQCRSYRIFLGCVIIRFEGSSMKKGVSESLQINHLDEMICKAQSPGKITTKVSSNGKRCLISLYAENLPCGNFIAQILPFDQNGPLYKKSQEIFAKTPEHEILLEIDPAQFMGIIFIYTMLSQSGEYDAVEIFSPESAPWELGESVPTVFSKQSNEPMIGRQQFPAAYTYDGSLCILGEKHLPAKSISNPFLLILKDSSIVTDWVDYWYTVTAQLNAKSLTN